MKEARASLDGLVDDHENDMQITRSSIETTAGPSERFTGAGGAPICPRRRSVIPPQTGRADLPAPGLATTRARLDLASALLEDRRCLLPDRGGL
jgi:hypothetical protein